MMLYVALCGVCIAEPLDQGADDQRRPHSRFVGLSHLLLNLFRERAGPATPVGPRSCFQKLIPHRTSSSAGAGLSEFGDVANERSEDVRRPAVGNLAGATYLLGSYRKVVGPVKRAQAVGAAQTLSRGSAVRFLGHTENV